MYIYISIHYNGNVAWKFKTCTKRFLICLIDCKIQHWNITKQFLLEVILKEIIYETKIVQAIAILLYACVGHLNFSNFHSLISLH